MPAILHVSSGGAATTLAPATNHFIFVGVANALNVGTETQTQTAWRTPGIFSKMYCRITANSLSTATATLTFRKNTANGNQTASIAAGTTGEFQDLSDSDSNAAGDLINIRLSTISGGTGTLTHNEFTVLYAAAISTVTRLQASGSRAYSTTSATNWNSLAGDVNLPQLTEVRKEFKIKAAGTLQNMQTNVTANTRLDTNTLNLRKNAGNGNQIISILTVTTGIFEDNSDTDLVAVNDLVDYQFVTGTDTHSITVAATSIEFLSTTSNSHMIAGGLSTTDAANQTVYDAVGGVRTSTAAEATVQVKAGFAYIASHLEAYMATNGVTAISTITFRRNGGNANQTISIGSSATGYFEDTTDVDQVVSSDEISYQYAIGATGTNNLLGFIGHLVTVIPLGFYLDTDLPRFDRDLWTAVPY